MEVGPRQALRRPETQERGQARTSLSAVRLHSQVSVTAAGEKCSLSDEDTV